MGRCLLHAASIGRERGACCRLSFRPYRAIRARLRASRPFGGAKNGSRSPTSAPLRATNRDSSGA